MHSAPPNGPHLDSAKARAEVRRLKPLIEQVKAEIVALEAAGGKLATLRHDVANISQELQAEEAKPVTQQNVGWIGQAKSILTTLRPELQAAEAELAQLQTKLSGYERERKTADEAMLAGAGVIERPSVELLKANTAYTQAVKERDDALAALERAHHIDGINEVVAHWLPLQPEITALKTAWDTQEAGGATIQISEYLRLGKRLTADTNAKIVGGLKKLPNVLSPKVRSATAETILEKYRTAYEAYEKAIATAGPVGSAAASDAFIDMEDTVAEFDKLTAANELTAAQLDPLKAAYEAAKTAEAAKHHAKILDAERELFERIPDDRARKLLVDVRVGNASPQKETYDTVAQGIKDSLKDPIKQCELFTGAVLVKLGLPITFNDLTQLFQARRADARFAKNSLGHGKPVNDRTIMDAMKQDVSVMLGLVKKTQDRKPSEDRLKRLNLSGPDARLLNALEQLAEPEKGPEAGAETLKNFIHHYLEKLLDGDQLVTDPNKVDKAFEVEILPLVEEIPKLFSGEVRKEQEIKKIDPAKRVLSPEEYDRVFIEIMGGKITISGPDPVAVRAAETAWVDGFYKSVTLAKEVETLNKGLRDAKAEFDRVKVDANIRPDVAKEQALVDELAKLSKMTVKVQEVFDKRGGPKDVDSTKTERNTFKAKEKERLAKKERELRDAETSAETKLEEAREALKAHRKKVHYKDHEDALTFAQGIVQGLEQLEQGTGVAGFFNDKDRKAWLAEITDFNMDGRHHKASDVVDQIVHRASQTPFAIPMEDDPAHPGKKKPVDISKQRMFDGSIWIPRAFYGKTLESFMKQPNGVISFYELLKKRTEKVRDIARWFVTNAKDENSFAAKLARGFSAPPAGTEPWSWPSAGLVIQANALVTEGLLKAEYADPNQTTPDIMAKACLGAIAQFMKDDFPVDPPTLGAATPLNKALFEETFKKLDGATTAINASREFVKTLVVDEVEVLKDYQGELPNLIAHIKKDKRLHALEITMRNLESGQEPFKDAIDTAEQKHNDAQLDLGNFLTIKDDQLADSLDLFDQKTRELAIEAAKTIDPAAERLMQEEARLRQELDDLRKDPMITGDRQTKRNSVKKAVSNAVSALAAWYERSATITASAQPTEFETRMTGPLIGKKKPALASYMEAMGITTNNAKTLRDWWTNTQADPKKLYTTLNPTFPDLFPTS